MGNTKYVPSKYVVIDTDSGRYRICDTRAGAEEVGRLWLEGYDRDDDNRPKMLIAALITIIS